MPRDKRIRHNRRIALIFGPVLLLTLCFIWGNSLQSSEASGQLSGSVRLFLERMLTHPVNEFFLRKAAHFSEYALLGAELSALLCLLRDKNGNPLARGRNLADFPAFGFLAAALDETIQIFTGRGSSLLDVWLDTAGFLTGFFLTVLLFYLFRRFTGASRRNRNEKL